MRIYAIYNSADDWHDDLCFYQAVMFHGEAVVPPERRGIASHNLDEKDIKPMRLLVNGYRLAEVFLPSSSCNLVVSERVMSKLRPLQSNFSFEPVAFEKVYNLSWSWPGEANVKTSPTIEYYRKRGRENIIARVAAHDKKLAASLPPYYEIVSPNHYTLLKVFQPTHRFFTMWYETKPVPIHLLPVSEELFQANPITHFGAPIIREDIFEALSPYLNKGMFGIKEFAFGDDARLDPIVLPRRLDPTKET